MLGSKENGHWTIARRKKHIVSAHRYQPHTLILDTTMETSSGTVVVTDFMPIRGDNSEEAALKLLYLALKNASKRWTRPLQDWCSALNRFSILWPDRMRTGERA